GKRMLPLRLPAGELEIDHSFLDVRERDELADLIRQVLQADGKMQEDLVSRALQPLQVLAQRKGPATVEANYLIYPVGEVEPTIFQPDARLGKGHDRTIKPD